MTANEVRSEMDSLLALLIDREIALRTNPVVLMHRTPRSRLTRITWSGSASLPGELFRGGSATVADYRGWLKRRAYSAVLYDGAIVQLTYDVSGRQVVGHRLAYFPCPFDRDRELFEHRAAARCCGSARPIGCVSRASAIAVAL
jgi:hypothetical protein